ncbi:MAG TPA: SRPBCC domain-containing protein [Azospirillaceae bacterium]|nr:SRPBCC domain-containing protein [Azospirillaceae bacterium]
MDMTGEYRIEAPRERVWAALNDPDVLRVCIPGCEEVEKVSDTEFAAKATVKVGPVKARFAGRVTLSDIDPPAGYTITGEGQGGAAGFGKGGARVDLAEDGPGATVLRYTAEAQVGGKLAQIGSRLIQGTAKKMADDFFGAFAAHVGGASEPAPAEAPTPAEPLVGGAAAMPEPAAEPAPPAPEPATSAEPLVGVPEAPAKKPRKRKTAAVVETPAEPVPEVTAPQPETAPPLPEPPMPEPLPTAAAPVPERQAEPPAPEPSHIEPSHVEVAPAAGALPVTDPAPSAGGLRPLVWIPLLLLVLLLVIVLAR